VIEDIINALAAELSGEGIAGDPGRLRMRQGVIVSVDPAGFGTVRIGGDSTEIPGVKIATHVVVAPGDSCWLMVDGADLFVIAKLGAKPDPFPFAMAAGSFANATTIAINTGVDVARTFPVGRFTQPPIVLVNPTASARLTMSANNITTAGFTARLDNFSNAGAAPRDFNWVALQLFSGSAGG